MAIGAALHAIGVGGIEGVALASGALADELAAVEGGVAGFADAQVGPDDFALGVAVGAEAEGAAAIGDIWASGAVPVQLHRGTLFVSAAQRVRLAEAVGLPTHMLFSGWDDVAFAAAQVIAV